MRLLLLILVTSFSTVFVYGQVYDSIPFVRIQVNGLALGAKKEEVIKKFGEPHKTVTTENNRGADIYIDYVYDKSTLRVNPPGVFYGFKLTDNNFILSCGKYSIRPGDSLKEFAIYFPKSFSAYAKNINGKFKLKIRQGNFFIVFKTRDGVISEIETKEEID
ncbi:MAG: hypothetical protein V4539_05030 [Bacteroidota bacterium]